MAEEKPQTNSQTAIDRFTVYGSAAVDAKRKIALGDPRFLPFYIPQSEAGRIAAPGTSKAGAGAEAGAEAGDGFRTPEPVGDEEEEEKKKEDPPAAAGEGEADGGGYDPDAGSNEGSYDPDEAGEASLDDLSTGISEIASDIADFVSGLVSGEEDSIAGSPDPAAAFDDAMGSPDPAAAFDDGDFDDGGMSSAASAEAGGYGTDPGGEFGDDDSSYGGDYGGTDPGDDGSGYGDYGDFDDGGDYGGGDGDGDGGGGDSHFCGRLRSMGALTNAQFRVMNVWIAKLAEADTFIAERLQYYRDKAPSFAHKIPHRVYRGEVRTTVLACLSLIRAKEPREAYEVYNTMALEMQRRYG